MPLFVESPIPPQLDLTGPPSQIFTPTRSSASSALYRTISRKRCRHYESGARAWTDPSTDLISATPLSSPDGYHPSMSHLGTDDLPSESDYYRPNRYKDYHPHPFDGSIESLAETSEVRRKRSRRDHHTLLSAPPAANEKIAFPEDYGHHEDYNPGLMSPAAPVRWTRAVLGVVGKVWGFCWSGAFRGFYAGGGQGYAMTVEQGPSEKQDTVLPSASPMYHERDATPVPGGYPDDEIRQNWVMVPSRDNADNAASSSRKRRVQPPHHRRAGSALMRRRQSGNRTLLSTPSSSGLPSAHFSSPAKPRETPVSVETQRYMAQRRRIEREEDASISRLNRQLQAMIKEGQQALGTRVEVDDYMEE
ncbi:uncharacterized protein KD926_004979 [Aspergillus affinis]|uniref:uncharacterized protein n=1 Tax=Aspergillus affinis TaxID=1070780 RepID=UPI0022FE3BAD|nr:uncharacterized protein KD926_004979 [Aspergillus affinis]KAI9042913.1 hypothetical protein KD926_004979 [Aspergillus affinis]